MKEKNWLNLLKFFLQGRHGEEIVSEAFLEKLDAFLEVDFYNKTGISPRKENGSIQLAHVGSKASIYSDGMDVEIAFPSNYSLNALIKWKTKTGEILLINKSVYENDEFTAWFEELPVEKITSHWNNPEYNPYIVSLTRKKWKFKLSIQWLNLTADYILIKTRMNSSKSLEEEVLNYFSEYNEKIEKKKHRNGVIHYCAIEESGSEHVRFYFDFGSAGIRGFEGLLKHLNSLEYVMAVEVTGV